MARYTEAKCKQCRLEGEKLFLKGDRCITAKCAMEKKPFVPGQHGRKARFRRKVSDYGLQLREKQKARKIYGVLERQFRRYFGLAERQPGMTGANLLCLLERRLDNTVYRLGFADSRDQARQLVTHGHFDVNGTKGDIASMLLNAGDRISVRERSRKLPYFQGMADRLSQASVSPWLSVVDPQNLACAVTTLPSREQIGVPLKEQLIVEFYSR
jgi:small subunit ribosomal protein S4